MLVCMVHNNLSLCHTTPIMEFTVDFQSNVLFIADVPYYSIIPTLQLSIYAELRLHVFHLISNDIQYVGLFAVTPNHQIAYIGTFISIPPYPHKFRQIGSSLIIDDPVMPAIYYYYGPSPSKDLFDSQGVIKSQAKIEIDGTKYVFVIGSEKYPIVPVVYDALRLPITLYNFIEPSTGKFKPISIGDRTIEITAFDPAYTITDQTILFYGINNTWYGLCGTRVVFTAKTIA